MNEKAEASDLLHTDLFSEECNRFLQVALSNRGIQSALQRTLPNHHEAHDDAKYEQYIIDTDSLFATRIEKIFKQK